MDTIIIGKYDNNTKWKYIEDTLDLINGDFICVSLYPNNQEGIIYEYYGNYENGDIVIGNKRENINNLIADNKIIKIII